jgi:hypothetical protein
MLYSIIPQLKYFFSKIDIFLYNFPSRGIITSGYVMSL